MNVNKSDASTSTEDIKGRPLCLFYFTHPFGVVSPEPPTVTAAPSHISRTFLNMEPVSPFTFWTSSTEESYNSTSSSRPPYDYGKQAVPENPRKCTRVGEVEARCDRLSSSLLSSEVWFDSSSSCGSGEQMRVRRLIPYNQLLPPLQLPRNLPGFIRTNDVWPKKYPTPGKLSLPPIELPALPLYPESPEQSSARVASDADSCGNRAGRIRRRLGVRKRRRRGPTDVRRMVTCLLRRAVRGRSDGGGGASPALRRLLRTVRDAWPEHRSLFDSQPQPQPQPQRSCSRPFNSYNLNNAFWRDEESETCDDIMLSHPHTSQLVSETLPRPDASPGLLRRRYSVPETIMRKYCVAQQRADCEESRSTSRGSAGAAGSAGSAGAARTRGARVARDRELMRKSALLRRLWGRVPAPPCCGRCREELAARHSRSLDGSHSELRRSGHTPPDLSLSTYRSHARADIQPWQVPDVRAPTFSGEITSVTGDTILLSACEDSPPHKFYVDHLSSSKIETTTEAGDSKNRPDEEDFGSKLSFAPKSESSYEMLEIVITESKEARALPRNTKTQISPTQVPVMSNVNIDEYVSNVLVESLNSLSDRLEFVTSRVPGDGKISVIEKEIKVKLQSTGVNTIVHLSPTSNNQIIFGNEELCDSSEKSRFGLRETPCIRDERLGAESDDAVISPQSHSRIGSYETFDDHENENVNRAVRRQIQKLFEDEMRALDPEVTYAAEEVPSISHIEISNVSNVDFVLNDSTNSLISRPTIEGAPDNVVSNLNMQLLSGVGTGSYFETAQIDAVVPRFTALPHTASMEVNASSEEAELVGSDCTSLVDSLDDPNSPRSVLLRRSFAGRKTELVRSAVDVLDLLPETVNDSATVYPKESEYFYVGIEDSECRCKKENINVADRMPEKIKQRLYRRHRRRQLRMESARRSRFKEHRREFQKLGLNDADRRRNVEKDCAAIIDALINDVISKIAQDEYKCACIKRQPERSTTGKLNEKPSKKNRKTPFHPVKTTIGSGSIRNAVNTIDNGAINNKNEQHDVKGMHQIRGKLSLLTRPALPVDGERPRRVYQKSEIREGNKCIEILEILEYVNSDKSSPNTPGTDECQGFGTRSNKKSRIPIPVHEKSQRQPRSPAKLILSSDSTSPTTPCNSVPDMIHPRRDDEEHASFATSRVPLPHAVESRARSSSMQFRRVFDVIPEERSSYSVESSTDDIDRSKCSAVPGAATLAAPVMKSVATSPNAFPLPGPQRVNIREGGGRNTRSWAARREEGIPEKSDSVLTHATSSDVFLDQPPRVRNSKHLQTRTAEGNIHKKLNSDKSGSRETRSTITTDTTQNPRRTRRCNNLKTDRNKSNVEPSESDAEEVSSSAESVLCPLAPRWLTASTRRRRPRKPAPDPGEWSVTVAGSCRAALPADVEMRLRFPRCDRRSPRRAPRTRRTPHCESRCAAASYQECRCSRRQECAYSTRTERSASPRTRCVAASLPAPRRPALTFTLKKEARDSSVLASKSTKKSIDSLPDLETYSSSHSKIKSSVKMRRGCSLQCWPAGDEPAPLRASEEGLAVSGCAIIPELKPRAPTMSERDLTRLRRRYYLRS